MENKQFEKLNELISTANSNIAQIAILQHGETIYTYEWNGFKKDDCLHVMSVTKSIIALLIGIAIDKGYLNSIDTPVISFFPDYKVKRGEKTIYNVTLRHLLTMTAPYKYKSEPWTKVCTSMDWTVAALDLLGGKCGITGEFKYSTLGVQILCGILEKTSGISPLLFANKYLFAPLNIAPRKPFTAKNAQEHKEFTISKVPKGKLWFVDPRGIPTAGYGLCLSSEEMAKIGQLCLNKGVYNGKKIVSEKWIEQITMPSSVKMDAYGGMQYGMLWWIINSEKNIYAASGTGGNVIYVNPEFDAVVAAIATFKPTVYDRIPFIEKNIIPLLSI